MSEGNPLVSRRRLLKGTGALLLLSVSGVSMAATSHILAVRIWPSSTYSRMTLESNVALKYKQFALTNPDRLVIDIDGLHLNSVLKGVNQHVRVDDPFIKSARVGQFDANTVRVVLELKRNVSPKIFSLDPRPMR